MKGAVAPNELNRALALRADVGHRTFDFSSDVGVEGEAKTPEAALVELARAMAQVITDKSRIEASQSRTVRVAGARDLAGTAVAWINELVFLFDTEQFLVADGNLRIQVDAAGVHHVEGQVLGERFDPGRHNAGRGVKAATFHDAEHDLRDGNHRFRLVLDL